MEANRYHNQSLEEIDVQSLLHPSTSISDHLANGPRIMVRGNGVHVEDIKGRRYIDGAAGLWCVNVGYGRQEIADADMGDVGIEVFEAQLQLIAVETL